MRTRLLGHALSLVTSRLLAVAVVTTVALSAEAQPAPQRDTGKKAPDVTTPKGADVKRTIDVDDPMLAPVPAARNVLGSWEEGLKFISGRDADLQIAILEVERARGLRREALSAALPQINATGTARIQLLPRSITLTGTDGNPLKGADGKPLPSTSIDPNVTGSISLVQPILAPRAWYAIGTADRQIEVAKMSTEDKKRTLTAAAANAIVAVVSAERVAEINRVSLKAALGQLALQKIKVKLGGGANLDTVRFEQDVAVARATLITGDEALMQSRDQLGIILGSAEPYGVPPNISLDGIERSAAQTCKQGNLADRPDLRAARAQRDISKRGVTDADLLYSPTAQISTTAAVSNQTIIGTSHGSWDIEALLTIPIWDGGFRYGAHRVAKAQVGEDDQRLDSLTRTARVEVTQANRGVAVATRSLEVAKINRDLAAENERLEQIAFDAGAGTSFDLVDAQRKHREAELDLAQKELALIQNKVASLLATATCNY